MESIFANSNFTKEEVVRAIKRFIPNFEHEEKGKNLDQKCKYRNYGLSNSII